MPFRMPFEISYPNWLVGLLGGGAGAPALPVTVANKLARLSMTSSAAKGNQIVQASDQTVWMLKANGVTSVESDWVWVGRTQPKFLGTVANESVMLGLAAVPGDFCFRSDVRKRYDVVALPVTDLASWAVAPAMEKADVGLGNVDNTEDANKPVSIAQAAALAGKIPLSMIPQSGLDAGPYNNVAMGSDSRLLEWSYATYRIGGPTILRSVAPGPRSLSLRFFASLDVEEPEFSFNLGQGIIHYPHDMEVMSIEDLATLLLPTPFEIVADSEPGEVPTEIELTSGMLWELTGGKLPISAVDGLQEQLNSKQDNASFVPPPLSGVPTNAVLHMVVSSVGGITPNRVASYPLLLTNGQKYAAGSTSPGFQWITGGESYWALCGNVTTLAGPHWRSASAGAAVADPMPSRPDLVPSWTPVNGATGSFTVASQHVGGTEGVRGQESINGDDLYKCVSASPRRWVRVTTAPLP